MISTDLCFHQKLVQFSTWAALRWYILGSSPFTAELSGCRHKYFCALLPGGPHGICGSEQANKATRWGRKDKTQKVPAQSSSKISPSRARHCGFFYMLSTQLMNWIFTVGANLHVTWGILANQFSFFSPHAPFVSTGRHVLSAAQQCLAEKCLFRPSCSIKLNTASEDSWWCVWMARAANQEKNNEGSTKSKTDERKWGENGDQGPVRVNERKGRVFYSFSAKFCNLRK